MISDESKKYRILAAFLMATRYGFFFLFSPPFALLCFAGNFTKKGRFGILSLLIGRIDCIIIIRHQRAIIRTIQGILRFDS